MATKELLVLAEIRKTHDTTSLDAKAFSELARAVAFYLSGGQSVSDTARLAIEEVFPVPQR